MRINQIIIAAVKGEATASELLELEEWRRASAENERYHRDLTRLWTLTEGGDDGLAVRPPPGLGEILVEGSRAPSAVESVTPLVRGPAKAARIRRRRPWLPCAAAGLALFVGAGVWGLGIDSGQPGSRSVRADEFVTGVSETATVSLRDGTVVRVAPNSSLTLQANTTEARRVALKGRAFFAVTRDESRPFHIRTEAGYVTVLGTRFDLQVDGRSLRLIVLEGSVALSAAGHEIRVERGEMGRVLDGTLLPVLRVPDPIAMMSWVGRFLAFQDTPLGEVAREIGREYGVEVEIADTSLATRTVTGWFANKSLPDVLRIACAVAAVRCTEDEGVVTVEPLPRGILPGGALSGR